jgi:hypothetical protein
MTAPTYCTTCEQTVHPTHPHSCFSAATLREHKEAEQKVIAAAKVFRDSAHLSSEWYTAVDRLDDAVEALRAVEGEV